MPLQLGAMTRVFHMCPAAEALQRIADLGFTTTSLLGGHPEGRSLRPEMTSTELAELRSTVNASGLKAVAASGPNLDVHDVEPVRRQIQHAGALAIRHLILMGVRGCEGRQDGSGLTGGDLRRIARAYDELHPVAQDLGVQPVMKPHGGLTGTGPALRQVVEATGGRLGVYYDPGNLLYYKGVNPAADLPSVLDHVVGLCVKDQSGGIHSGSFPVPGEGDVNWRGVLTPLHEQGFQGPALIEIVNGNTPDEVTANLQRTRSYLEQLTAEIEASLA